MNGAAAILVMTAAYPLARAWLAHRRTPLVHALIWAALAWLACEAAILSGEAGLRYLALCLTGCAGVAVLGARRPGVGAWNFVVVGLLALLLLPVAEGWMVATPLHLNGYHLVCLSAVVAVGILNYLPTRGGLPAFV